MTIEELKEEAKKLGYDLIPRKKYISLKPCTCGRKRNFEEWWDGKANVWFYKCPICKKAAPGGKTHIEARRKWNEMIEKG